MNCLAGYAPAPAAQALLDAGRIGDTLRQRYPEVHGVRSGRACAAC